MKPAFLLAWLTGAAPGYALGQIVLYEQNFQQVAVPALPPDWFSSSSAVYTDAPIGNPSSGYAGASGGNCLVALNCNPTGELRSFQVDGISTTGASGLVLSFGHRRTSSFTPPVTLEWSSNGTSWQALPYSAAGASAAWSLYSSPPLPLGTQNQESLSFRWSYTTNVNNTACEGFAGNYRIDDVRLTALALPIELVFFEAENAGPTIVLRWQTATELENLYFDVERSADGRTFAALGRVAGAGTSTTPRAYAFTDAEPPPGISYYRLKQVDFDAKVHYSPVRAINRPAPDVLTVGPSPAQHVLRVRFAAPAAETASWEIASPAAACSMAASRSTRPQ